MDRNALLNDNEEGLRLMLDGRQAQIYTTMPGIIQSVDLTKMTCSVQPAIQGVIENDDNTRTFVNLPLLVDCPIIFPNCGDFAITFPLAQNDEVLISVAARCIDAWWQSGGVQKPIEARMHDLSDGFVIPGPRSQVNLISAISTTSIQIRNKNRTSYIEIAADGKINLVSAAGVYINGIPFGTHVHGGVTTGIGLTGGPV